MKNFTLITLIITFVVGAIYGYIVNLLALIDSTEIVGLTIARAIGVFLAPLGSILGFF